MAKIVIKKRNVDPPPEEKAPVREEKTSYHRQNDLKEDDYESADYSRSGLSKWLFFLFGFLTCVLLLVLAYFLLPFILGEETDPEVEDVELVATNLEDNGQEYTRNILSERTRLVDILREIGVATADAKNVDRKAISNGINVLNAGTKYTSYQGEDGHVTKVVFEPKNDLYNKHVIDLENFTVDIVEKVRTVETKTMAAIIESGLGITFVRNNLNLQMIKKIENIFAWSIDLFRLKDGDRFKIIYKQEYLDGKPHQILDIEAAYFVQGDDEYYAFRYKENNTYEYFNEDGQSLKKSFLKSPIKYGGVITSGFGLRVHPVKKKSKMHLGTDFAAPEGTPIVTVADGVILKAAFTANNGNYVKVKHDRTYTTQYLHMTKWAEGMKPGRRVRQGDVIGYVGSTGLATGPHVCFRFWKNNEQVNPKTESAGVSAQINPRALNNFITSIKPVKKQLSQVEYL